MATKKATAAPKSKSASAADLLGNLNKKAKKDDKKPASKARNTLTLPKDVEESLIKWVEAKLLADVVEARQSNTAEEVKEAALELMLDYLWEHGRLPSNPSLKLPNAEGKPDIEAMYTLQKKFKELAGAFPVSEDETPEEVAIRTFVDVGLSADNAEALTETELDFTPQTGTRPLNELVEGHYGENREWVDATPVEQEAGRKLLAFLTADADDSTEVTVEALTDDERDAIIRKSNRVVVRAGFHDRVRNYVTTRDQLAAVFTVLKPVHFPSRAKLGISDTPERKNARLVEAAADILGVDVAAAN
jgi:hypothetical protein